MKQQDIAIIIVVGVISAALALGVTKMLFSEKNGQQLTVETVAPIDATFNEPDKKIFNNQAINPTQLIQIGGNNTTNQF